ncbi:MAG: thiamine phosphate synthase, partial [Burkholderiales bacterium]|nr:thiamine phosphate synthase [Burkholderiales bacterium]
QAARANLSLIHDAKARFHVPIVAIGGITVDNARQLISANADMVAVITSLFDADDIELRAREFVHLFTSGNHVHQ